MGPPPHNRAVLDIVQIFKAVMSLAANVELGVTYINRCEAVYKRAILNKLGCPQAQTQIHQ